MATSPVGSPTMQASSQLCNNFIWVFVERCRQDEAYETAMREIFDIVATTQSTVSVQRNGGADKDSSVAVTTVSAFDNDQ
eukprot:54755-Eustigmatos_ZCMA.PRE.1